LAQQMGVPVEQFIAQLVAAARQMGVPVEQLLQQLMQQAQGGGGMGAMGGMGGGGNPNQPPTAGYGAAGGPPVMAAPGVRANPTPNTTPPRVGRQVRPVGVASGRAPGVKRQGQER
jgi:hypothetical protein